MKRLSIILLAMLAVVIILTGCSKTTTCAECHKVKKCKMYTVELLGQKEREYLCDDCYILAKGITTLFGGKVK